MEGQRGCSSSNSRVFNSKLTHQHSTETSTLSLETFPTLETELRVVNKIVGSPALSWLPVVVVHGDSISVLGNFSIQEEVVKGGGWGVFESWSCCSGLWHEVLLQCITLLTTCCYSLPQSCLALFDPMNCSTSGFPVLHYLSRACSNSCLLSQWCHPTILFSVTPLSSCPKSGQHQGLFQWVSSSHQVPKVLEV